MYYALRFFAILPREIVLGPSAIVGTPPRAVVWLWIAAAVSAFGPLLVFLYFYHFSVQTQVASATARLARVAQIAQQHALRVVETNEVIYRALQERVREQPSEVLRTEGARLHRDLVQLTAGLSQLQSVWVWDIEGRPVASSRVATPPPTLRVDDRDYFKVAKAASPNSGWHVSEPLRSRMTGEPFFDFTRRRSSSDGAFLGVVSVSLFPSYFTSFFKELSADDTSIAVSLLRLDGTVIARHPDVPLGTRLDENSPLRAAMARGLENGVHDGVSSIDGREKIVTFERIGQLPLYVAAVADKDALLAAFRQSMYQLGVLTIALSLALTGLCLLAIRIVYREQLAERGLLAEAERRLQLQEALRHAQKLEALGHLTGSVAHDFNNILMVVQSSASLLARMASQGKPIENPLSAMRRAVDTGSKLTRQLLAFARRQPLKIERCSIGELLRELEPLLASASGSRVCLSVAAEPNLPAVEVDVAELELALMNLVANARDAMEEGGSTRITAEQRTVSEARFVVITVQDTGPGIPEGLRDRVMEPFFTTKPPGKGTGLGLSQVRAFAEQSGGQVTVDSTSQGACIRIELPASGAPHAPIHERQDAQIALPATLIMVEDNEEISSSLLPLLESHGASVRHFKSADEALMALTTGDIQPDVILSDIQLPGRRSGVDLAMELRVQRSAIPVVLMTGYTTQLETAVASGFTVLAKPVSPDLLLRALTEAARVTVPHVRRRPPLSV